MSILFLQIIAVMLIWLITMAGGLFAFYLRRKFSVSHSFTHLSEAFAGGIFLGAALFHMLPDAEIALKNAYGFYDYPLANLICAGGFCLLLFLETLTDHFKDTCHQPFDSTSNIKTNNAVPLLLTGLISVHALSEGIALGVNQTTVNIIIIFIAIAAHKSSEAFAVGLQLQKSTLSFKKIALLFLVFSGMTPAGIMLGSITQHMTAGHERMLLSGFFNAFAAGTFIYLATLHQLHHAHPHSHLKEFFLTLTGLALMALVAVWI